ncbi:MAG: ABCB family ABC transporter ATP-binding protein/permease [Rhizomicrobium sp.]
MRDFTLPLKPLRILIPYLWPARRLDLRLRTAFSILCLIVASALTAATPLMLSDATDSLSQKNIFPGGAVFWIAALAGARVLAQAFTQLRDLVFANVAFHATTDIARRAFAHLHSLSPRFHVERRTGALLRTIERGMRAAGTFLTYAVFTTIPILLQIAIFTAILLWKLGIGITLVALATIGLYVWFTFAITRRQTEIRRAVNARDNDAGARMVDSLLNYETVKAFAAEAHERRRFDREMARFARTMTEAEVSLAQLNIGQAAILALGMGAIMAITALGIRDGVYTLGDFVLGNAILMQLYQPLNVLGTVYHEVLQGLVDLEALTALFDRAPEIADPPGATPLAAGRGAIRFDHVTFAYGPGRTALDAVSFEVPAGKTVAIVGPSGAGKSTVARILLRFYDVAGGSVSIDGQDISRVTLPSLRAAIGVVPQDAGLFNDTIRYNIAYGRLDAAAIDIEAAARVAQIDGFIRTLPQGYDTIVGERGLKLSGGERQRLAIARAVLKNPPILLLDEATSALDTHSEHAVQAAIEAACRGRTTLTIAHRLSTIVGADEILVLVRGEILERGTHEALLARRGHYAAMWRKQQDARAAQDMLGSSGAAVV